jgi:hypothetical protein
LLASTALKAPTGNKVARRGSMFSTRPVAAFKSVRFSSGGIAFTGEAG